MTARSTIQLSAADNVGQSRSLRDQPQSEVRRESLLVGEMATALVANQHAANAPSTWATNVIAGAIYLSDFAISASTAPLSWVSVPHAAAG